MELAFGRMILVTPAQLLSSRKFASLMALRGSYAIEAIPLSRYTLKFLCLSRKPGWLDLFTFPVLSRVACVCVLINACAINQMNTNPSGSCPARTCFAAWVAPFAPP